MSLADAIVAYVPLPSLPSYLTTYQPGVTPLSTPVEVGCSIVLYLSTIFGIRALRKDKQPLPLNGLFQIHNIILTAGSGLLLALMAEEIIPIVWKHGLFFGICNEGAWTKVRNPFLRTMSGDAYPPLLSASRVLLHDQLLYQIRRTVGYRLPRPEEEASG